MTSPTNDSIPPRRCRHVGSCVIIIAFCVMVVMCFLLCSPKSLRSLHGWRTPKTFWRKDHDKVVRYHIRDYRVPWAEQLLAAIAVARDHGERLYLEDTSPTEFARNRGNVKTVDLSELVSADCVVICPIMMLDERSGKVVPVTNTCFLFGLKTKHRTEDGNEFSLWYPAVTTNQHGLICLPVYREMTAEIALEAVDADGTRFTVETFGLRDIVEPYRFGLYEPVVLSEEQRSQLTSLPGFEEELRYVKHRVFANLSLNDTETLRDLGIAFEEPNRLHVIEDGLIMPTLRYADVFGGLHFRGLTRTELTQQILQYREKHADQKTSLTLADGENFIVSRTDGRIYLCRFLAGNTPQESGVLDVWDLGWRHQSPLP